MKKRSPFSFFAILKNLAFSYLTRLNDLAELANLERQLAKRTVVKLIAVAILIGILIFSVWLCALLTSFILLTDQLHLSNLIASLCLILLNIILLVILAYYASKIKENLLFPATRRQLHRLISKIRD